MDDLTIYRCTACQFVGATKMCERCKVVHYCSRECQLKDWPDHRPHCKVVSALHFQQELELVKTDFVAVEMNNTVFRCLLYGIVWMHALEGQTVVAEVHHHKVGEPARVSFSGCPPDKGFMSTSFAEFRKDARCVPFVIQRCACDGICHPGIQIATEVHSTLATIKQRKALFMVCHEMTVRELEASASPISSDKTAKVPPKWSSVKISVTPTPDNSTVRIELNGPV